MTLRLSGNWELSTEHQASTDGRPVLVRRGTREAYGPDDVLQMFPSYGLLPARQAVARLARASLAFLNDKDCLLDLFLRLP